ncbi:MAG: RDD family protein [Bacteroidota bacterium]|nr:RDD family protein [Ferruginibacter sp.]
MHAQHLPQGEDLLLHFDTPQYIAASSGKRLANYLVDLVLFYLLLVIVLLLIELANPDFIVNYLNTPDSTILERILILVFYGLYMFSIEAIFKGKSPGKFITGTRAVSLDGEQLTFSQALQRGFSRAVPFNEFSALGRPTRPWHDKWSKTMVIDEKRSVQINE